MTTTRRRERQRRTATRTFLLLYPTLFAILLVVTWLSQLVYIGPMR